MDENWRYPHDLGNLLQQYQHRQIECLQDRRRATLSLRHGDMVQLFFMGFPAWIMAIPNVLDSKHPPMIIIQQVKLSGRQLQLKSSHVQWRDNDSPNLIFPCFNFQHHYNTWICLKIGYADIDGLWRLWRLWLISQQTYIRITINWGVAVYPTFLDPNSLHIEIAPAQAISHPFHPKSPVLLSQEVFVEVLKGMFLGGANDPTEVGKWLIDWHGSTRSTRSTRSTQKKLSWCMSLMRVYACIMYLQWQYARLSHLSLIYNGNM